MGQNVGNVGDAAGQTRDILRLKVIRQLEHAIAGRQLDLEAARRDRDAARETQAAQRGAVSRIDDDIKGIDRQVHRRAGAVYLNGASLDRGTLALGNEAIRYSGWHGKIEISLNAIKGIELGTSDLPPRAGIPVLDRIWPGKPRGAETILLRVQTDEQSAQRHAVIADLSDAAGWREEIRERQQRLGEVADQRARLLDQREKAAAALAEANGAVDQAQAHVDAIEGEIAELRAQLKKLRAQQDE